jgi:hypothetical protein
MKPVKNTLAFLTAILGIGLFCDAGKAAEGVNGSVPPELACLPEISLFLRQSQNSPGKDDFASIAARLRAMPPGRRNAFLGAAYRGWPLFSAEEKKALLPAFYPPLRTGQEPPSPATDEAIRQARQAMASWWGGDTPELQVMRVSMESPAYVLPSGTNGGGLLVLPGAGLDPDEVLFHAFYLVFLQKAPEASPWLAEAFAVWAMDKTAGGRHARFVEAAPASSWSAGLGHYSLLEAADPSFLFYLDQMVSPSVLASALLNASQHLPGAPARDVLAEIVSSQTPYTMENLLPRFSLWTLQRGRYGGSQDFPQGALWPDPVFAAEGRGLPRKFHENAGLAATGMQVFRLSRSFGEALSLSFEGQGARFEVNAMAETAPGTWEWLPLKETASGFSKILFPAPRDASMPLREEGEILIAVLALEEEEAVPASFTLSASLLADYPVRLQWGGARMTENTVVYDWTTGHEENVFGWLLWTETAAGERTFSPAQPIPSPGFFEQPMRYHFSLRIPESGAPQSFGIRALTRDGLAQDFLLGRQPQAASRSAGRERRSQLR